MFLLEIKSDLDSPIQGGGVSPPDPPPPSPNSLPSGALFGALFLLLLSSMGIRQQSVLTQAKQIDANVSIQDWLNKKNAQIHFSILPPNANTAAIDKVQTDNQLYTEMRLSISNLVTTMQQKSSMLQTEASTNLSLLQQTASMNSGWLKTLADLYAIIDQLNQPQ